MKKYLQHKPTNIDWISEIPSSWNLIRIKSLFSNVANGVWGEEEKNNSEDIYCIRVADFDYRNLSIDTSALTIRNIHKGIIRELLLKKGDILIEKSGGGELTPIGRAVYFDKDIDAVFSNFITRLQFSNGFDSNFLKYALSWLYSIKINIRSIKQTTGIQNLDLKSFFNEVIAVPSIDEQRTIAIYLDKITGEIERFISLKQKLIELLKEERIAIINHAVSKGVNPNAGFRRSKLECLYIPTHWKEIRAKNVFFESNDKAKGDEELLSVSHYTGVTPRSEKNVNMFLAESYEGYKLCKKDDLVINTMWAWMGALGISEYEGIVSSGYGVYRLKDKNLFIPQYLNYLLRTPGYVGEYIKRSKGIHSSRWRLYPDEFFQITIICPAIEEQRQIIDYIQRETQNIDQTVARFAKEIDLLKEYRTALISEVVTGKIDVRDEVALWT